MMAEKKQANWWLRAAKKFRTTLLTGIVVLVPIGVTLAILEWLFSWMAGFLVGPIGRSLTGWAWMQKFLVAHPKMGEPIAWWIASIISVVALVLLVYLVGLLGGLVVGKRIIKAVERALSRVPLVKTIYGGIKQIVEAVSLPNRQAFKAVVTLEFPAKGMRTLGFITGHINVDGQDFYRVFIPTVPNPTTGFFEICSPDRFQLTDISVEDALKTVISGGILAPPFVTSSAAAPDPKQFMAATDGEAPRAET
jgi:uncharacterized membrane protein